MKFRYLGDHVEMKVFGYDFTNGATPDVTEACFIGKLSNNSHFEAVKEVIGSKKKLVAAEVNDSEEAWPLDISSGPLS